MNQPLRSSVLTVKTKHPNTRPKFFRKPVINEAVHGCPRHGQTVIPGVRLSPSPIVVHLPSLPSSLVVVVSFTTPWSPPRLHLHRMDRFLRNLDVAIRPHMQKLKRMREEKYFNCNAPRKSDLPGDVPARRHAAQPLSNKCMPHCR